MKILSVILSPTKIGRANDAFRIESQLKDLIDEVGALKHDLNKPQDTTQEPPKTPQMTESGYETTSGWQKQTTGGGSEMGGYETTSGWQKQTTGGGSEMGGQKTTPDWHRQTTGGWQLKEKVPKMMMFKSLKTKVAHLYWYMKTIASKNFHSI